MNFVTSTGYDPRKVTTIPEFVQYAAKELGCSTPVGKQRFILYNHIKAEMQAQEWTLNDLIKTVRYCKAFHKEIRSSYGILYHVWAATKWVEEEDHFDLQMKVAEALQIETDEVWLRRLSLASGKALSRVYDNWLEERGDLLRG